MKKIWKKILSFSLAAGLLFSAAACGNNDEKGSDGDTAKKTEEKEQGDNSSASGGEVNLTVWNEPPQDDDLNMYLAAEKATGIKVNVTVIPETEYSSKLNQMVATGDSSQDIFIVWENDIKNFADTGGIRELDSYLENSSVDKEHFIDAVAELTEGLGGTYGLPWCAAVEIMYYNQDLFDEAGIEYPDNNWPYEEFLSAAEKLTKKADDGSTEIYGSDLPNLQTWWAGIGIHGDQVYDPASGELVIGEGAEKYVSDVRNMVEQGYMPEPSSDTADLFATGKAAMAWLGSWNIGVYGGDLDFDWEICTIPTADRKYNTLHTGFYTINDKSKNQDDAWKVIEYLMSEEGQNINSAASGNPSAIIPIAEQGVWKVESAKTIENWEAVTDALESGVFGYTSLPSGITGNAVSEFESAALGMKTPEEAVEAALDYAKSQ